MALAVSFSTLIVALLLPSPHNALFSNSETESRTFAQNKPCQDFKRAQMLVANERDKDQHQVSVATAEEEKKYADTTNGALSSPDEAWDATEAAEMK